MSYVFRRWDSPAYLAMFDAVDARKITGEMFEDYIRVVQTLRDVFRQPIAIFWCAKLAGPLWICTSEMKSRI